MEVKYIHCGPEPVLRARDTVVRRQTQSSPRMRALGDGRSVGLPYLMSPNGHMTHFTDGKLRVREELRLACSHTMESARAKVLA